MDGITTAEKSAELYKLYKLDRTDMLRLRDTLKNYNRLKSLSSIVLRVAWNGAYGYESYTLNLPDAIKVIEAMQYKVDVKVWIV